MSASLGENYRDLALAERGVSVPQKIEKLLYLIAHRTEVAGQKVSIAAELDAPLINAVTAEEFRYLLRYLLTNRFKSLSAWRG